MSLKLFFLLLFTLTNLLTSLIFLSMQLWNSWKISSFWNHLFPWLPEHCVCLVPSYSFAAPCQPLNVEASRAQALVVFCFFFFPPSTQALGFLLKAHGFSYPGLPHQFSFIHLPAYLTYPLVGKASKVELLAVPQNQLLPQASSSYVELYRTETPYSFLIFLFSSLFSTCLLAFISYWFSNIFQHVYFFPSPLLPTTIILSFYYKFAS